MDFKKLGGLGSIASDITKKAKEIDGSKIGKNIMNNAKELGNNISDKAKSIEMPEILDSNDKNLFVFIEQNGQYFDDFDTQFLRIFDKKTIKPFLTVFEDGQISEFAITKEKGETNTSGIPCRIEPENLLVETFEYNTKEAIDCFVETLADNLDDVISIKVTRTIGNTAWYGVLYKSVREK